MLGGDLAIVLARSVGRISTRARAVTLSLMLRDIGFGLPSPNTFSRRRAWRLRLSKTEVDACVVIHCPMVGAAARGMGISLRKATFPLDEHPRLWDL